MSERAYKVKQWSQGFAKFKSTARAAAAFIARYGGARTNGHYASRAQ
jgi:hypothetical protein